MGSGDHPVPLALVVVQDQWNTESHSDRSQDKWKHSEERDSRAEQTLVPVPPAHRVGPPRTPLLHGN